MVRLHVFAESKELFDALAREFEADLPRIVERQGSFAWALAGGTTPRQLYERLAHPPRGQGELPWDRVLWFWGDERAVPPDHPASNYGMAKAALLDHLSLPEDAVRRLRGELEPEVAAAEYEVVLRDHATAREARRETSRTLFDWVLLGLGEDGHTASLFPGGAWQHAGDRWVIADRVPGKAETRLSLTGATLRSAKRVLFLVSGAAKAHALAEVLEGAYDPATWPAQVLLRDASGGAAAPEEPRVEVWCDRAAAAQLRAPGA